VFCTILIRAICLFINSENIKNSAPQALKGKLLIIKNLRVIYQELEPVTPGLGFVGVKSVYAMTPRHAWGRLASIPVTVTKKAGLMAYGLFLE